MGTTVREQAANERVQDGHGDFEVVGFVTVTTSEMRVGFAGSGRTWIDGNMFDGDDGRGRQRHSGGGWAPAGLRRRDTEFVRCREARLKTDLRVRDGQSTSCCLYRH